jgi:serine/threonine protein kinase
MSKTAESEPPDLQGLTFVKRIGTGGYADVYLYQQTNTQMRVAVKVLFKEAASDKSREQFAAEANAMAELAGHPNIVQVFGADVTADGRPYLVMKYYPQRNLAVRSRAERLPVQRVLEIGVQVSCAVETAHRAGILHRDIKPANILTSQYGEPGLADFGIATRSGEADDDSQGLSIPWSAPEVVFALSAGDIRADVYSLGATLWHLLVGRSPFEDPGGDNSTPALMRRIREKQVPRTGRDDVPGSLERLLAQAMAKDPDDRPQTALQLARSLQAIEAEELWTPTPLVLLEDNSDDTEIDSVGEQAEDPSSSEDSTRRRTGGSIVELVGPRTPDSPTLRKVTLPKSSAAASPSAGSSERRREGIPPLQDSDEDATKRRPAVVGASGRVEEPSIVEVPSQSQLQPQPKTRTWKLVVASAIVVAAAIGIALFLTGSGGKTPSSDTAPSTSTPPTIATPNLAAPVVTGERISPTQVKFTWTMANVNSADRFYWKEPGGQSQLASGMTVTVNAPAPQKACITVEAVRGQVPIDSPLTCRG